MSYQKYMPNDFVAKFTDAFFRIKQQLLGIKMEQKARYSVALRYTSSTPSGAGDTGTKYQVSWDASYLYICTDTDTWKRISWDSW